MILEEFFIIHKVLKRFALVLNNCVAFYLSREEVLKRGDFLQLWIAYFVHKL